MLLIKLLSTWNKPINKEKYKIYTQNYWSFYLFSYFILFWGTIFSHSIAEKYLMIWFSLEYSIMLISDYLMKRCFKVFTVDIIYFLD